MPEAHGVIRPFLQHEHKTKVGKRQRKTWKIKKKNSRILASRETDISRRVHSEE